MLENILAESDLGIRLNDYFSKNLANHSSDDLADVLSELGNFKEALDQVAPEFSNDSRHDIEFEIIKQIMLLPDPENHTKMIIQLIQNDEVKSNGINVLMDCLDSVPNFRRLILKTYLERYLLTNSDSNSYVNKHPKEIYLLVEKFKNWIDNQPKEKEPHK